jgi:hypothetical protein
VRELPVRGAGLRVFRFDEVRLACGGVHRLESLCRGDSACGFDEFAAIHDEETTCQCFDIMRSRHDYSTDNAFGADNTVYAARILWKN